MNKVTKNKAYYFNQGKRIAWVGRYTIIGGNSWQAKAKREGYINASQFIESQALILNIDNSRMRYYLTLFPYAIYRHSIPDDVFTHIDAIYPY